MASRSRTIEEAKRAVDTSRGALIKQRQILTNLRDMAADAAVLEAARARLASLEKVHAEDLAELKRLTST